MSEGSSEENTAPLQRDRETIQRQKEAAEVAIDHQQWWLFIAPFSVLLGVVVTATITGYSSLIAILFLLAGIGVLGHTWQAGWEAQQLTVKLKIAVADMTEFESMFTSMQNATSQSPSVPRSVDRIYEAMESARKGVADIRESLDSIASKQFRELATGLTLLLASQLLEMIFGSG